MQTDEYIALSRKFRPLTFDDVTGHETVIDILKNQIATKSLAHAYLFTGLHGTGKTTLARILAKAINCSNLKNFNPCNSCSSCKEITASHSLDVLEIDGASNRGIDDIRNINETVGYATFQGKYKIYIIDEVHMLTKEAFNALLKTLEEPPSNTKFFLATTEAHKIPATILSRCQRIDLKRLDILKIKEKLISITSTFSVKVTDDALSLIARLAEGSMRDAESFLENIIAYNQDSISVDQVYDILGSCPKKYFFSIDEAFATDDKAMAFALAPKLFSTHTNLTSLIDELSTHFTYIAKCLLKHQTDEMTLFTEEEKRGYKKAESIYTIDQALEILTILADTYHYSFPPISKKIHVEMLLQKILCCKYAKSGQKILEHLRALQNGIPPTKTSIEQPLSPQKSVAESKSEPVIEIAKDLPIHSIEKTRQDTILQFASVEFDAKLNRL